MHHQYRIWLILGISLGLSMPTDASEIPFGPRLSLTGDYPAAASITAADLDSDGFVDLVAASYTGTTLSWWRSLGNGTFTRYEVASSVTDIVDVEIGDVNGDGHLDIIVTSADDTDAVGWFENDGTPTVGIWPLRLIAFPFDGAIGTASADIDADGDLDVVAAASSAHLVSIAYNGTGTGIGWSYEVVDTAFTGARWVDVGDLDHDGDLDVVAAAILSGDVSWWSRDAVGGTWTEHSVANVSTAAFAELNDFDKDGDLDILGAGTTGPLQWWENNGSGAGWTSHPIGDPNGSVWAGYAADMDADGDLDVIYASAGSDGIGWYENLNGEGSTWAIRVVDTVFNQASDIVAADFNADGDLDLAGSSVVHNAVAAWDNLSIHRSALYRDSQTISGSSDHVRDLASVDLDHDGDLDLLVAELGDEQITWLENVESSGSTWSTHVIKASYAAYAVAAGDLNGDGLTDVVGAADGDVKWWLASSGGTWTENSIVSSHFDEDALAVADLDLDGDQDVILGSFSDGIDWHENSGHGGSWTERYVSGGHIWDPDSLALADIDQDGDYDVAYASGDSIRWVPNNLRVSGSFGAEITVTDSLTNARSVAIGDIDGDGDLDLAGLDEDAGSILWWANTSGDGSSWGTAQTLIDGLSDPRIVRLADLDLDGDLDLALAAEDRGTSDSIVAWLENQLGDGSLWTANTVDTGLLRASELIAADLDGDGDPDLAYDRLGFDEIDWWRNEGGQAAFASLGTAPPTLGPLVLADVLEITASHRGRPEDGDAELTTLELFLSDEFGVALNDTEANALLFGLYVFEDDDDSGDFDPAFDSEVGAIESFTLASGVLTVDLPEGSGHLQLTPDLERLFFVALAFEADAAAQTPHQIEVTHLTASSVIKDRTYHLPLSLEVGESVQSGVVEATADPNLIFADGFESGDTSRWSSAAP